VAGYNRSCSALKRGSLCLVNPHCLLACQVPKLANFELSWERRSMQRLRRIPTRGSAEKPLHFTVLPKRRGLILRHLRDAIFGRPGHCGRIYEGAIPFFRGRALGSRGSGQDKKGLARLSLGVPSLREFRQSRRKKVAKQWRRCHSYLERKNARNTLVFRHLLRMDSNHDKVIQSHFVFCS
jgi:hypothetical protein